MAVGDDAHTLRVALDQAHGRVQAFVVHARQNFLDIVACTAHHAEPLRAVRHLDQSVVVAKADHGCHRKLQHLVGRATPDAAQHGQEIPIAKRFAELVAAQKFRQRLLQLSFALLLGNAGAQSVEAHHIGQHAPKARVDEVAPLGEHAVQVGAAPLQSFAIQCARHLDRKRHVRRRRLYVEIGKQLDQVGVGAFVEDQKTRVHPMRDHALRRGQRDIHRVGVAAKIIARLEHGDVGMVFQGVGHGQA